ncbi:serine/threonine protein kinase [Psychromonas antarctica]|uniref:serine/threonine protein kinase n=1 Tax=Psychromonas antarctica TaxID=67573 RepID=UPI001EE974D5|nr:serine/threonine protein kinase [Psychromonas antarctica]MCG6200727.1 serine/threonine protein kinase [Psychromonas antarctica]
MTDANFSYLSLTPEVQLDALASIGIYPESGLIALNSYENRVSLFTDENKIRYVVKFYRPQRWSAAQLQEEHQFTLALQRQGSHVAAPIEIDQQTLFRFNGYYFALFHSLSARSLQLDNIDQLFDIGSALGKMHRVGAQSKFKERERLDVTTMISAPFQTLQTSKLIPKFIRDPLFATLTRLEQQVHKQLSQDKSKIICLHGDCHASNILIKADIPYFVDFDDCKMGPAIQDIWMLLSGSRVEKQLQLSILLDGYQEEYDFDLKELHLIESLRSMRMINYVGWINKRWADPAFPMNFPWFTTDQYWKELLQSLQQQTSAIKEAPLSLQPSY